ncbi:ketoacyl-synt-domain-containing protein [Thozetella sp. PMI_491]|nr:ketoacyl-synt-domain-containing protein [Thozetella sp. PMI_491]
MHSPMELDIAIVGMACRFPGDARNPEELWRMLVAGRSAHKPFPSDRLNIAGFYHPSAERADSFNFREAHFIDGDIAAFDREFFDISADEARAIDPQQRLLLEVAYEALENSGVPLEKVKGTDTSVWIGSFVKDYEQISMTDAQTNLPDCATGNGNAILANRISFAFDLHGTSQTIDTGCSGSLVTVHQAVQDLRLGNSDMALAGGVGLIMTPGTIMPMTSLGFLSKDGKSFTFDSRANGYGRGEGAGIVVLKTLQRAIQDGDTIRGIIRGTASNQDGRTPGITVPNPDAQIACIKRAYARAGLPYTDTLYVECHGTGTMAGDPRELKAISQVISNGRSSPLLVGSIKPNIGHLEGAAGIAGFIKAVLILEKGQIPKHINFENWNPDIKHEEWRVDVPHDTINFPVSGNGLRRVSVNCFGFGGTNAHAILDDARSHIEQSGLAVHHNVTSLTETLILPSHCPSEPPRPYLFMYSAKDKGTLQKVMESHIPYVEANLSSPTFLHDYEHTLYFRRSQLLWSYGITASSPSDLLQKMSREIDPSQIIRTSRGKPTKFAYIFCGQGAQWIGMGKHLMGYSIFRKSIMDAARYMGDLYPGLDLLRLMSETDLGDEINLPQHAQPATTALQVALVEQLQSLGISPAAVVGHSSGEIAAAFAAGYVTREQAWSLALHRGMCAAKLSDSSEFVGGMLAVALSQSKADEYISLVTPGKVCVACINSPSLVTLSGDREQIMLLKGIFDQDHVFNRLLAGTTAYHSYHMYQVAERYRALIAASMLQPAWNQASATMYSSLTGALISRDQLGSDYWVQNMVRPVEFEKAVSCMLKETSPDFCIEVSPRPVWARALTDIETAVYPQTQNRFTYISLSQPSEASDSIMSLPRLLWTRGCPADITSHFSSVPKCLPDLPPYSWNHSKSYLYESHISKQLRFRQFGRLDFIGAPTNDSIMPIAPKWRGFFRVAENPWLMDHKVQGEVIYPAAGMVVMAIEAGKQLTYNLTSNRSDILDFEVTNFDILAPMIIPVDLNGLEHVLSVSGWHTMVDHGVTAGSCNFVVLSRRHSEMPYQINASGVLTVRFYAKGTEHVNGHYAPSLKQSDWKPKPLDALGAQSPFEFYEGLNVIGMNYGTQFRNIVRIGQRELTGRSGEERWECETVVRVPDTKSKMPMQFEFDHIIHPATLDGMFQTVFTLGDRKMLPVHIDRLRINGSIQSGHGITFRGLSGARETSEPGAVVAHIDMVHQFDDRPDYDWAVEVKGLVAKAVAVDYENPSFLPSHRHLCSKVDWEEAIIQPADITRLPTRRLVLLEAPGPVLPLADHLATVFGELGVDVVRAKGLPLGDDLDPDCPVLSLLQLAQDNLVFNLEEQEYRQLQQLLINSNKLFWITRGAQMTSSLPSAAPFIGWTRTVRSEDATKHIVCFDVSPENSFDQSAAVLLRTAFLDSFATQSSSTLSHELETEYAELNGRLYVPRLRPMAELNSIIERGEASTSELSLDPEATYLLIGGLGGLGLDIAEFLASHGAKHIALFSRSGLDTVLNSPEERSGPILETLARLEVMGVETYIHKVDICDQKSLSAGLTAIQHLPPMKGMIHAAGVLQDLTYRNMTYEAWVAASRVKMVGSSNLHQLLPHDLDFFILLSSAAGVIGNRGQANYAAGNAFQDALARHRRSLPEPLPAISLDLGPIIGAGMVDQEMMDHLRSVGFFGIRKKDFHAVLAHAIGGRDVDGARPLPPQIVLGVGTGGLIKQNKPADPFWARTALFEHLNRLDVAAGDLGGQGDTSSRLDLLNLQPLLKASASVDNAVNVLFGPLVAAMANIIPNLDPADVKSDMTPTECNSDSMRGVNIDNWLKRTTGVSVGMGLNAMTIRGICEEVVRKGGFVTL